MLIKVAQNIITYDDVKFMFDNPASESWNPRVSTVPGYGLYLYDIAYDEADLVLPKESTLEQSDHKKNSVDEGKISLDLKKEIIKQRILNRKAALEARTIKSTEKIKNYELLRSVKK